jgi:rod shape-determining protein MreC
MSQLRFNHIAIGLMSLSFVSAFLAPPRFTNPARGELAGIFSPISRPIRGLAGVIYDRFHPVVVVDDASPQSPRSAQTLLEENRQLNLTLAALQVQYDNLSKLNADRQRMGNILSLCSPANVTGSDSSTGRESLLISASSGTGLTVGRAVLCAPHNLMGRIVSAGLDSAQVQLITDPGVAIMCRIAQYKPDDTGTLTLEWIKDLPVLVQGVGKGGMTVRSNLSMAKIDELQIKPGDIVGLNDPEWPANLQGWCVGRIAKISPQAKAALVSDIQVVPLDNLMRQREVMVMVKD